MDCMFIGRKRGVFVMGLGEFDCTIMGRGVYYMKTMGLRCIVHLHV